VKISEKPGKILGGGRVEGRPNMFIEERSIGRGEERGEREKTSGRLLQDERPRTQVSVLPYCGAGSSWRSLSIEKIVGARGSFVKIEGVPGVKVDNWGITFTGKERIYIKRIVLGIW